MTPMADEPSHSLEAFERRWRLEKTPQTGLRLAELYRRRDDLPSAIEALKGGLEVYPNHTASRVALSRYLIDGERFAEAIPHLEKIIALDPAHLVANKLLVGAYAGVGRIEEGRDKLAIYEMMGEGDADIESLQRLLDEAEARVSATLIESPFERSIEDEAPTGLIRGGEPEAAFELTPEVSPAFFEPPGERSLFEDSRPAAGPVAGESSEAAESSEAPEPPEVSNEPFGVLPGADAFTGAAREDRIAAVDSEEPFGAAFGPVLPSPARASAPGDDVFSFVTPAPPEFAAVSPAAAGVEDFDAAESDSLDDETPLSEAPTSERKATVTLGRLYLEQGLRERALDVFEEVLADDPENEEARRELEVARGVAAPSTPPDTQPRKRSPAEDDVFALAPVPETAMDLVERKKAALIEYRARLRSAVAAGV